MAYINPTGTIQLFRGINLDNRYMHTLYFETVANQTAFFDAFVEGSLTFTQQNYSRPNRNMVRVRINAENCQDVTYMRFNNNRGNGKWYYAFVNAIDYVNENTTDIVYEIDIMQTWFFQTGHNINPCFVKREHVPVAEDKLKKHLEPEPVSSDLYRFDSVTPNNAGSFGQWDVVMNTTNEVSDVSKLAKDGIVCGTEYWNHACDGDGTTQTTNLTAIKSHILQCLGSWDKQTQSADITDMYMYPRSLINQRHQTFHVPIKDANINYAPDNVKLWSYPYSFLFATTKAGESAQYKWELFDADMTVAGNTAEFSMVGNSTGGGSIIVYPRVYNGIDDNIDSKFGFNDFPKCSWSYDAYQAFVANGGSSKLQAAQRLQNIKATVVVPSYDTADVMTTVAQGAKTVTAVELATATGGIATPLAVEAAAKTTGQIATTVGNVASRHIELKEAQNKIDFAFKDARYAPDIVVGKQIPNIAVGERFLGIYFYNCHLDPAEMLRIDNFFTVYGYSVNQVKTPTITGRAHWNFLQTEGCQITGNMPASSKEGIARILDGGIFFWNSTGTASTANSNIGNFMQGATDYQDFGKQLHNR